MKKKICGVVFVISFFLLVGIVGGVDCGEPVTNMFWCIPCLGAMWLSAIHGNDIE
jgi:hypothetical protein